MNKKHTLCVKLLACVFIFQAIAPINASPNKRQGAFQKQISKLTSITQANSQSQTPAPQNVSIAQDMSSPAQNTNALAKINETKSTGKRNTALGVSALQALTDGSDNIALGKDAGKLLETGSFNIYIGSNANSADESGAIHLGTTDRQEKCYIAGISGVTPSGDTEVVIINADGQLGSTTLVGGGGIGSYGQLSISGESMPLYNPDTWIPVRFTSTGVSASIGLSTSSPATITIASNGIYQIGFSVYFSVDDADEHTFDVTTYTLGLKINDTTTPVAAVHVGESGHFSLNFSNIIELAASDEVQFYMKSSNTDYPPFANHVSLEKGNAYVMQIAS